MLRTELVEFSSAVDVSVIDVHLRLSVVITDVSIVSVNISSILIVRIVSLKTLLQIISV